jgi:hypothetical protein
MTNDWKKNFIYYSVLALLALSTVVVTVLKVNVKLAPLKVVAPSCNRWGDLRNGSNNAGGGEGRGLDTR